MSERASGEHAVWRRGQLLNVVVERRLLSFSEAAAHLRELGAITYQRGRISVLDAGLLLERACECYAAIKEQVERLPQAWNDALT